MNKLRAFINDTRLVMFCTGVNFLGALTSIQDGHPAVGGMLGLVAASGLYYGLKAPKS